MQLPSKDIEVDGHKYRVALLTAVEGRGIYLRLIKALGPALDAVAQVDGSKDLMLVFAKATVAIVDHLEPSFFDELCGVFGKSSYVQRVGGEDQLKPEVFGIHFAGRYDAMSKWLIECIRANGMLDFLSEIWKKLEKLPVETPNAKASPSQTG